MSDYDLLGADFYGDPYPILAEMRREDPCWFDHRLDAFVLTRYGDVARVLQGEDFSAQRVRQFTRGAPDHLRAKVEVYVDALERWLLFVDPPHHTRLRARLQRAFGPALLPVIGAATRDAVRAALDELDGAGSADVIACLRLPRTDARAGQGVRHLRRRHRALQALDHGDLRPDRRRRRRRKRRRGRVPGRGRVARLRPRDVG